MARTKVTINEAALQRTRQGAGERIKNALDSAVRETKDQPVDQAVPVVQQRMRAVGAPWDAATVRDAVETMRAGKAFTIRVR